MRLSWRWVISPLMAVVMILAPAQTMACIPGLQWGMDSSTVEERLNVSLETARSLDADSSVVYRISSQHIGDIPVEELDLRFSDQGLEQRHPIHSRLAITHNYSLPPKSHLDLPT